MIRKRHGSGNLHLHLETQRFIQIALGGVTLTCLVVAAARNFSSGDSSRSANYDFDKDIEPVLAEYCYDCHGGGMDKGGVVLDDYETVAKMLEDRRLWENVYHNMEGHLMPPGDKPQPGDEDREMMVAWIEKDVFGLDADHPDPGRVTLRRLNRREYNNTVSDLFGVTLTPADAFPEDDTGYGFDNVGDVLSLSPDLFERYLKASGDILDKVMVTEAPLPKTVEIEEDKFSGIKGASNGNGRLSSTGTVGIKFKPPSDGDYRFEVLAGGSMGGEFWPNMRVEVEKGPTKEFTVSVPTNAASEYSVTTAMKKGQERYLRMSFTNDHYEPKHKDPNKRDRNLAIFRVRVIGPLNLPPPPPGEAHRRILALAPDGLADKERAREILKAFSGKSWRRPVADEELNRILTFYENARKSGESFDQGIKRALQAVLMSPKFLYRGEVQPDPDNPEAVHEVDEFALATRLSYFLWSTTPDGELLGLAAEGKLRANLPAQIDRLLAHPRSAEALTENFAGQWLQLRNLRIAAPDRKSFPRWSDELRDDMLKETETFVANLVKEDRSSIEILDADYSWLNERLANFYGVPDVKGNQFQRVSLTGNSRKERGGVLTHGSILTITSNPTRTSAVNRGNFVLENFLGTPAPPPPEGVDIPPLEAAAKKEGGKQTLRQQLEVHREKTICASCHARMDPIGFGLENFDAIGAWRDKENGLPIDTSGKLYTGESFESPGELRQVLIEAKTDAFVRNMADKMLIYALGRGTEYYDKPAIRKIVEKTAEEEFRFHSLVRAIIDSVPFQMRRGDSAGAEIR